MSMPALSARGRAALALVPLLAVGPLAHAMTRVPSGARAFDPLAASVRRSIAWIGSVPPGRPVRIGLVLGAAHPRALAAYALAVSTPGSPVYHRFLTAVQVARRFGPSPAVVAHDVRALQALGFRAVRRQGSILYAGARASVVARALGAPLRLGREHRREVMAPARSVRLPAALRDVVCVTGLVARVGARPAEARVAERRPAPLPLSAAASTALQSAPASGDGPYSATSAVVGPKSVPTGLPVTIRTTVTGAAGAPDATAQLGGYTIVASPPGASISGIEVDGPDSAGNIATTFTAYVAGAYQLTATLQPAPGVPAQTITLPTVTFTGGRAVQGPVGAAQLNAALGAAGVVADEAAKPASIAVFATTTPNLADVSAFAAQNHLSPLRISATAVDGGSPAGANDGGELSLDLESLAIASPGAQVHVYDVPANYSGTGDTFVAVMNAVEAADDVSVLSLSYAQPEASGPDATAIQQAVEALNTEGITVVVGAGDNGAFGVVGAGATAAGVPASPADTPEVTAVGGVDLRIGTGGGIATSYWGGETYAALSTSYLLHLLGETGTNGNVLGGGGYSRVFAAPPWQKPLVLAASGGGATGRGVPDVAMPASPDFPGVVMVLQGQATTTGGTSMAAPLFAGYLADIAAASGSGFGDVNPDLYAAAASDPTLMTQALYGYDGKWSLGAGAWNPLTGLGTPDIGRLAEDLTAISQGAAAALVAVPSAPTALAAGQTLTATFTATTAGGKPAAGVHLRFDVTGSLAPSGLGAASGVTDAAGQASVTFQAGGAESGTIVATAPGGLTAATARLTVSAPRVRALRFAFPSGPAIAGVPARLGLRATMAPSAAPAPALDVVVEITGPRRRTLREHLAPGAPLVVRLVKSGRYAIRVHLASAPAVRAVRHLHVLPARPARYALATPLRARAGVAVESRLTAYDAFGNVDTAIAGRVRFTWRLGGRLYGAVAVFRDGVARASLRVPAGVSGALGTSYAVLSAANAPAGG